MTKYSQQLLESRIPVYIQVMDSLIAQMEDGTIPDEMRLPSERELCDIYSVSRTTIRQALKELEKDGLVRTYKGRGTFATAKRINQDMSSMYSFTESMKRLGKKISTKLVDFSEVKCDGRTARKMQCNTGESIHRFTRVRYVDAEPIFIVTTNLPYKRFPDFDAKRLASESLYTMLINSYNVTFSEAKETLQSVCALRNEAELLQMKCGDPCMKIDRYTYEKGELIEYAVGIARGDKFEYNIKLK